MKRTTWGILAGGAVAATFLTSATADAETTPDVTWTPTYDIDSSTLVQAANSTAFAFQTPATFTPSTGTALSGTDYVTTSSGGYDNVFVTGDGATYAQDQLGLGFTNLYYDPSGTGAVVDMLKTPFGTFDISPFASLLAPADYADATTVVPTTVLENSGLYSALDLGLPSGTTPTWSPVYGTPEAMQTSTGTVGFETPSSFTTGTGADATTLTGTDYITASSGGYDNQFVTDSGAIYDQDQLGLGFTNLLYYDPSGTGAVVDMLKTPFGTFDISPLGTLFTPVDLSSLDPATPLTDLTDSGLYSALDLGLTP
jgi:roadblock/LC7 domain-containing protein